MTTKRIALIAAVLFGVALTALLGGIYGKRSREAGDTSAALARQRCAYDGQRINPVYGVTAYLSDSKTAHFCSIHCARAWLSANKDKTVYVTVADEVTGETFDSSLATYVQSDIVNVAPVNNRIHAFLSKQDAEKHAAQFNGKIIENPFGTAFQLPAAARFESLTVATPNLPDALPFRLALLRPIFKENRLNVKLVPFTREEQGARLIKEGSVDAAILDLPTALALAGEDPKIRIVKNILRANPFRPLYAIVAKPDKGLTEPKHLRGKVIAVPPGKSYRFYLQYFLKRAGAPVGDVDIKDAPDLERAWEAVTTNKVDAAILRTPYTDAVIDRNFVLVADDRSLPWMSVLVLRSEVIERNAAAVKRFIFALEQSVLALNLKPDEFHSLLGEKGGLPSDVDDYLKMPIFEGANAPAPDELAPVIDWLISEDAARGGASYANAVDTRFLPNPEDVGLAFCCR